MLCFLDIDGVICLEGSRLDPRSVNHLNALINHDHRIQVVFNSAWNTRPLVQMRTLFVEAGFMYPNNLIGQTLGLSGGGGPVRSWLQRHAPQNTPYIIIDDSTRDYNLMWGRLVRCLPTTGFDEDRMEKAMALVTRTITPVGERRALLTNLSLEIARLIERTPWLTEDERLEAIAPLVALWAKASDMEADNLLSAVCLSS
jgi:hypothetical protein